MDKKQQFYEDLYVAEMQSKPTQEQLASFINQKQSQIAQILWKKNGSNLWLDDIIALREQLSLPEYIQLDEFNKITQLHIGKDEADTKRYDDLLKLPDHGKLLEVKSHQPPKVEKLIKYQWSKLAQWLVEIVANAIDASNPNQTVGRFWEGFYQALKFLENKNDILKVSTKAQWNKWFDVNFKQEDGIKIGTLHNNQLQHWTIVSLQKQFNEQILKQLSAFVTSRFKTNTYTNVYLNGKLINDFSHTTVINGKKLEMTDKPSVHIELHQQGFSVKDEGIGMNSKTIAEKLVYPTGSSKKKINPSVETLPKLVEKESKFFYTSRTWTNKESTIRLQVAGVVIEEFKTITVGKIDSFTLECPSFTWLPESRNQIVPERAVVLTIKHSLEKIQKQWWTLEEKIMLTEMIWKIINKLKQRKTDETEKKYTLEHIAKQAFTPLKEEIEKQWWIVLPWDKYLMNRLWTQEWVYYVSPDFIDLKVEKIPWITSLDHVAVDHGHEGILRKKKFFVIDFAEEAEHDYLITEKAILVNKKVLYHTDLARQILNTSINLNIWYELPSEMVYYGTIKKKAEFDKQLEKEQKQKEILLAQIDEVDRKKEEQLEKERERLQPIIDAFVDEYGRVRDIDHILSDDYFFVDESEKLLEDGYDLQCDSSQIYDKDDILTLWVTRKTKSVWTSEFLALKNNLTDFYQTKSRALNIDARNSIGFLTAYVWYSWKPFALAMSLSQKLLELFHVEPEYMQKITHRFGKSYRPDAYWWEIFSNLLEWEKIPSVSTIEIPYDEIKENIFTHPSLKWYWKVFFDAFPLSLEFLEFKKKLFEQLWTLTNDQISQFQWQRNNRSELGILIKTYFWNFWDVTTVNFFYILFQKIIDCYTNLSLQLTSKTGSEALVHIEKYYEQEQKLKPFTESFAQWKRPESELWDEMYDNWRRNDINPGLELTLSDGNLFLDRWKKYRKQVDEILARPVVNLKNIDTELWQNPRYTLWAFKRKNKETQSQITQFFDHLDNHFSDLYTNILSDNWKENWLLGLPTNYSIEDCREEIFDYYNKKEYLKDQLQTNAQFRETLCEMIDISSLEIQDWGKSKLELLNKELRSDMIDWFWISPHDQWLHIEPIINVMKQYAFTRDTKDLEKLITTYPYLDFLKHELNNNILFKTQTITSQQQIESKIDSNIQKFNKIFYSFQENHQIKLLNKVKWYTPDIGDNISNLLNSYNGMREIINPLLDNQTQWKREDIDLPFFIILKILSELYYARIEWRFEQPKESKETMYDVKYSRVFEEIMKWTTDSGFCNWTIYQNELLDGLKERLMTKFDSTKSEITDVWYFYQTRCDIWFSEIFLSELSEKYIKFKNSWISNKWFAYDLQAEYALNPWKFSKTLSSRLFDKEWKCVYLNIWEIYEWYLIEQEIIAFLKELDQKPWEHIDENIFDNELEELKSKLPIYLETTDSWLVDQLFWAYNNESEWRFVWWSKVLREQFPEFEPVTSMLEKGQLISLPTMVDKVNKNVFENLTDDDSLLFLEYIHQKIWWEENKNEMFDLQIVMDIINKFQELSLSTDNSTNSFKYNRHICIPIIQVYRNIYIKRKQAQISFPQEFEGTMFDEEYNEIFNIIINSNEIDILKRDDLTKLWLWKLVADLWVFEWRNQPYETVKCLEYLSKVYIVWLQTAVKSFTVLWDEYCIAPKESTWESMFIDNTIYNGFLRYVYQKHSDIYTNMKTLLQEYRHILPDILAWVEYEKTIIESLKQLKEKKIAQSQWPTKESIIAKLSKTYPQDIIVFAQFLLEWGEFLKEENSAIEMKWELSKCKLSELIGMSRFMPQEIVSVQDKNQLDTLIKSFTDNKNFSNSAFTRDIYSSIEGQDKSSMINIREKIQNGIDAIKKAKRNGDNVPTKMEVNFFAEQGNWVTQVQDPVGMNLHKVLNYLLIPWNSDKDGDDWQTGMFGQWFRSSAIWAKELRIKTSPGDGQLYQLTLLPIYNEDNNLDDFVISVSVSQENFKGTIIERVDDKSWIQANLRAMIWVHNMQKYVGNVESIDIMYGKQKINTPEKNIVLQSTQVPWYGEMKLIKTSDNIVRWTKDNLYINEIPDDFLLDIPVRMKEYVESQNLTIDIPPRFWLTKSRNSLADYEEQLKTLRPHLFDMLINYILKEVVKSQLRIPMLPEDYFGLDLYERRQTESSRIAQRYSNGLQLTDSEIDYLKDKAHMAEFLVQIPFEWNGNTLSLLEMKRRRNEQNMRKMMNIQWWLFGRQFWYYADIANKLNTNLDRAEREDRKSIQVAEKLWIEKESVDMFVEFMNVRYKQITQQQFSWKVFDLQFSYRPSGESGMAFYKISWDNVVMSLNVDHIKEWIIGYNEEVVLMKIDKTITHELNHMLESPDKRWSHEKDLEHNDSFEKMQRALLTAFTRLS